MEKGVGKDKPRGKARGILKSKKKKQRLLEEKKNKKRAEIKRQNSERRKEKSKQEDLKRELSKVEIIGFKNGMFIVLVGGKQEKRSINIAKDSGQESVMDRIEIKLFGNYFKAMKINGFENFRQDIEEYLED